MTDAQAADAERAWRRHHALAEVERSLATFGRTDRLLELRAAADAGEVERLAAGIALEVALGHGQPSLRKMAHLHLARFMAKRGDEEFRGHLRKAAYCQLEEVMNAGLGIDMVDILPGADDAVCLATGQRSVPIHRALREEPIPNPRCPRGFGGVSAGYCTCMYVAAKAWFERR